jgi:serine/threonine protein kinase
MVMEYMNESDLRKYLQQKNKGLSLEDKFRKLRIIIYGLRTIHTQGLVHRDFHAGNVLNISGNKYGSCVCIADLGLSQPASHQKQEGEIYGVLPYVAPEVLRGQFYTKAADIYSFGIVTYELLANSYPYVESNLYDIQLALAVCQGLRPDMDELKIPQLLKDLIKRC